jgi:hypothetical protein
LNGDIAQGGYALYNRSPGHFVIKIPDSIPSELAAPMMCAGVTTYSPLKQNGCGPGKRVGVVGIGGLGHFAILWAKALGADKIIAISRKADKANDALELGADAYIATEGEGDWVKEHKGTLDIIISTVSSSKVSTRTVESYKPFNVLIDFRCLWVLTCLFCDETALSSKSVCPRTVFSRSLPAPSSRATSSSRALSSVLPVSSVRCFSSLLKRTSSPVLRCAL